MKTRSWLALAILTAVAGTIAASLWAADPQPSAAKAFAKDVKCPVTGKPINPSDSVDFENGKVYFCCENCPVAFQKNPEKYAAKAHLQMVQTEQLKQVACPLTGKPINPDTALNVGGVKVAFCCNICKGKVQKASGDDQVALVFKDVSKGFKPTSATPK